MGRGDQNKRLEALIKKHEELIPTVLKTQVKVDLYWKCYAYGDELKPHIEFLDGIMLSSTRDIAPSCVENVDELTERQEKSLSQLETRRPVVNELIGKGKVLLENPDKPKFLEGHVQRIILGWDDTKNKATERLTLLQNTKAAWVGYYEDLERRQKIFAATKGTIDGMWNQLNKDFDTMTKTLPEDKKDFVKKEVKAVSEKLPVVGRFEEKVVKIETFVGRLNESDTMTPEDRVSTTMELSEDVEAKVAKIKKNNAEELELLPQGDKVPQDAEDHKAELKRIETFVLELQKKVQETCDHFSEDVKFWAQYKTGIRSFMPWLTGAETKSGEGLTKPQTLDEANAMFAAVSAFDAACLKNIKLLQDAADAANKMTTHKEADDEVAALKERYGKVKAISDEWMKKADTLVKEWKLLDNTVTELNSWVAKDRDEDGQQSFSLEKMESTLGELKNIFKEKEKLVENL